MPAGGWSAARRGTGRGKVGVRWAARGEGREVLAGCLGGRGRRVGRWVGRFVGRSVDKLMGKCLSKWVPEPIKKCCVREERAGKELDDEHRPHAAECRGVGDYLPRQGEVWVWCGVVWCGREKRWCGVVWCGVMWCGVTR